MNWNDLAHREGVLPSLSQAEVWSRAPVQQDHHGRLFVSSLWNESQKKADLFVVFVLMPISIFGGWKLAQRVTRSARDDRD